MGKQKQNPSCRKIDALIKDEYMANKEYSQYASQSNVQSDQQDFTEMAKDEAKHKGFLESMKKWYCHK